MNTQDPKYQQKSKAISSAEVNYLSQFEMRYPVEYLKITEVIPLRNTLERLRLPNKLKIMATFVGFMHCQGKCKRNNPRF